MRKSSIKDMGIAMPHEQSSFDYEEHVWGDNAASIRLESKRHSTLGLARFLRVIEGKSGKVLEIGCGTGVFLRSLKIYCSDLELFGCDISKTAIEIAKSNQENTIDYMVADAVSLPYENKTFDVVVMMDVLEHLKDMDTALVQANRVLKDKGIFYLLIPCEANRGTLYWLMWKLRLGHNLKRTYAGHIQRVTRGEVHKLLKDCGFTVIKETYSFHILGQIYDIFFDYLPRLFQKGAIAASNRENVFSLKDKILRSIKERGLFLTVWLMLGRVIEIAAFYESQILKNFPLAIGVHITCRKGELI